MNYFRTITLMIVCYCLTAVTSHAQTVDERLWGKWDLDSVIKTANRVITFKPDE